MRRAVEQDDKRKKVKTKTPIDKYTKLIEFVNKIKLDKKNITILVICLAVIVCLIAVNNYTALGLVINKNITSEDVVEIQLQTVIDKIIPLENEILVYSKDKILIYNNNGKNTSTIQLENIVDADISAAGKYIQVINKDKNLVYVYRTKYEVARIKIDGKIRSGSINSEGTSVVEYSSNGDKITLGVYDNSGKAKYNIRPSNNIIGKYVLSNNSKYLAYTDVDISGISANTNINLINLSSINQDEGASDVVYSLDNSLAYDIYWDGKDIITRFEDEYVIYDTSSKEVETIKISEGQLVSVGEYNQKYAYTKLDENGNYLLAIRNMKSDKIKIVELDETPKYFKYNNGIAYVCYAKKIEAYNNFGAKIKNFDSDMVITEPVIFNNGRSLAMAVSNKLIMFTI